MSEERESDWVDVIVARATRGDVFRIEQNGKPVAIVVPARYEDKLREHFPSWTDGRLMLPDHAHGWRRRWHICKGLTMWLARKMGHSVQNPQSPGAHEAAGL